MSTTLWKDPSNPSFLFTSYHKIHTTTTLLIKNVPVLSLLLALYCSKKHSFFFFFYDKQKCILDIVKYELWKYSFVYLEKSSDERTERGKWSKEAKIAYFLYPSVLFFYWNPYRSLNIKKEHLFWRWATHFFLAATQNMMNNLEKSCQIRQLPCLWSCTLLHFLSCIPYARCWMPWWRN